MVPRILILAAVLALAGCQTPRGSFCEIAEPIRLTAEEVDALGDPAITAVLAHNEKLERLCGVKP